MPALILSLIALVLTLGYAVLLLWRGRSSLDLFALVGVLLACATLEIFDGLTLLHPEFLSGLKRGSLVAEGSLPLLWGLFSLTFYRQGGLSEASRVSRWILFLSPLFLFFATFLPFDAFYYSPDFAEERSLFLGRLGYYFYLGLLLYLIFALVQLEMTYRSLARIYRWRAKFEMVGVGSLLAIMVVYYSQGLLYRSIDMSLMPVRSLALAAAVMLMAYSRLRRGEAVKVRVSQEMALRSVVVLAVGLYLLGLGLAGEGMRYLGESSQKTLFVIVAFLGGLVLLVALLSETLRRKTRVFLHKNFFPHKYDYRAQWQNFTNCLSEARSDEEIQGAILKFFAETFFVRGATLFMRDGERPDYVCAACHEIDFSGYRIDEASPLVRYLLEESRIFNAEERRGEGGVAEVEILLALGGSFVVPLRFEERIEGFLILGSRIDPDETVTYEDYDLMKMLARQASSILLSLRLSSQLAAAREMAAIGKVSAFVMHDLKNSVSNLALVVENARNYMDDPAFQKDMLETLDNTVAKMKGLIARLRNLEEKAELKLEECDLAELVAESAEGLPKKSITLTGGPVLCAVDRVEMGKVVLNLVLNAIDATAGEGPVHLDVGADGMAFIRCRDQGCGMAGEFLRERLFKPFETTKPKGFGIGLYQCRQIVEAHGGRIEVRSAPEQGSEFTVYLPLDLRSS